jgi:aminobutyraldehyde dehydrogenase
MVSLTGDIATGQKILQSAARTMKRTQLELGVTIFDDADLEAGIRTFGFYNTGQDCTAASRTYAQGKIYDKFVGGMKISGYGKDLSLYALEDCTVPRHIMVKL